MKTPSVVVRILCIAILAIAGAACQSKQRAEKLSDEYAISIDEQEARRRLFVLPDAADGTIEQQFLNVPADQRQDFRDQVIEGRVGVVNTVYNAMAKELRRSRAFADSAIDISTLTINAVGALVGPAQTKAVLHAISGGLIGSRDAIEKNYYESLATNVLVDRMDTLRGAKLLEIRRKMQLPVSEYKIGEAINDCDEYLRAGTIHAALTDLAKANGLEKKKNEDKQDREIEKRIAKHTDEEIKVGDDLLADINALTDPQATIAQAELHKADAAFTANAADSKQGLRDYLNQSLFVSPDEMKKRDENLRKAIAAGRKTGGTP